MIRLAYSLHFGRWRGVAIGYLSGMHRRRHGRHLVRRGGVSIHGGRRAGWRRRARLVSRHGSGLLSTLCRLSALGRLGISEGHRSLESLHARHASVLRVNLLTTSRLATPDDKPEDEDGYHSRTDDDHNEIALDERNNGVEEIGHGARAAIAVAAAAGRAIDKCAIEERAGFGLRRAKHLARSLQGATGLRVVTTAARGNCTFVALNLSTRANTRGTTQGGSKRHIDRRRVAGITVRFVEGDRRAKFGSRANEKKKNIFF